MVVQSHRTWTTPQTAADALGRIGTAAVPRLIELAVTGDAPARHESLRVLARIGPGAAESVPMLRQMLRHPDPETRRLAARALGQIGPAAADAVPELIELLGEPS
jgi:HEAT repeat protein